MKRLFLSLVLSLFVLLANAEGISNYKELLAFAKAVNKEADLSAWKNEKGVVCLKADIDMKKGKKFPTMQKYEGTFDGCGHKLYNWTPQSGLFHELTPTAVVKNLTIDSSCRMEVEVSLNDSNIYVAYIANLNHGLLFDCVNNGSIEVVGDEAYKAIMVGGLVARSSNILHNCKNTGTISVRMRGSKQKTGMSVRVGGLVGGNHGKVDGASTISNCENQGAVSYMGDFPTVHIGGIVGESGLARMKYCSNRGNVVAVGLPFTPPKGMKPAIRIGGITAWGRSDFVSCDNYAVVVASGAHESIAAGICARPNAGMNIVDCYNYGKISTNASMPTYLGGIVGLAIHDIHVANCYNFGEILGDGPTRANHIGGIVGGSSIGKTTKRGAYIRDCVNYGKITNKSASKYSGTGGIAGYCVGLKKKDGKVIKSTVVGCKSHGEVIVKTENGRTAAIVGNKKEINVVESDYNDIARPVKPLSNGENIFGRVVDTEGMPVEGAVVSDGTQCVKTDVNGEYAMKSDIAKVKFVQLSIPADYEIPVRDQRPQLFLRVLRGAPAARADFKLKRRENASDNFVLAMVGDPQTRGLGSENSTERFRDVILPDMAELKSKTDKDVYAINLGDLVYNLMTAYDDYVDVVTNAPVPMFSVIGNHDYDQRTLFQTMFGTPYFEAYLSPLNYSFNIGKMHFVVVNSILYNRATDKDRYKTGMESDTYEWLVEDLKHVSKETPIVICSHAPLFKDRRTKKYAEKNTNYAKYSELLSQYNKVYAWAGHTHQNYNYSYTHAPEEQKSLRGIDVITVARCSGQILLNRELNRDGTPNGYMVAEVNGDKMEWYYKSVGHDRDYQMRAYSPTRTNSEYVKVNIWNHSPENWSTPEWWENGVKVADMEVSKEYDLDYLNIYAEHNQQKLNKSQRAFSKPSKVPFMFKVKPSEGVRAGEVRVTDNFGHTYTQSVAW